MTGVVVIGAGQAGASLVSKLRDEGYQESITLAGDEPVPPYQRPPLSKKYLLGEMSAERLYLRPERYYADARIDLRLGTPVTGIDRASRAVMLSDERLPYAHLVLATGSVPRRLPAAIGGDLDGVHVVRTLADVDRMSPGFCPGARLLIVGGGYIGLEAAAVAVARGMTVTLVEMADRILGRVAAPETAAYFRDLHQRHGVDLREGVRLDRLTGDGQGRVRGAELGDGTEMEVDMVIAGVGIAPDTRLAEAAGLEVDNGVAVDAQGRTSDPAIWAVGDCASFPHDGARLRLESVPNAIDMAECVAGNIMGAETAYVPKPWFWSDQYDVKLQIAGLGTGYDRIVTRDGGTATSFWYYRGERLLAVDAMNDPRAYMVGKRLIEAGKTADPAIVTDAAADLKSLLKP